MFYCYFLFDVVVVFHCSPTTLLDSPSIGIVLSICYSQGMVSAIMNGSIWSVLKLLKALKSVEDYYPEYVDRIILFNAPRVAAVFYRAAKALLDPNTASKLVIHSSSNYETVFSKFLPLEAIPFEYGGTSMVEYPLTASQ